MKTKRNLIIIQVLLYSIIAYIIAGAFVFPKALNANNQDTVIYYIPHQDDELLTFGASIVDDVEKDRNVVVVLMTDGSATNVGKELGLTPKEVTKYRNREFDNSLKQLGVKEKNVIKMNFKDGELTQEEVHQTIESFSGVYPHSVHKGHTYHDEHSDHQAVGLALKAIRDDQLIEDVRFYIRRGESVPEEMSIVSVSQEGYEKIKKASYYYREDEDKDIIGIGYKSVPGSFDRMLESPINFYHH